jgi:Ni,Fe-hydrogenase maturation factor
MSTVFVFGNPDLPMDALPIRIIPQLVASRPNLNFVVKDPNEDWDIPEMLVVIDTVVGIDRVMLFDGLDAFAPFAHVSVHDFDAYTNLRFLKKLGKLKSVHIIGIPVGTEEDLAVSRVLELLPRERDEKESWTDERETKALPREEI